MTKPIILGLLVVFMMAYLGLLTSLNLSRYEQATVAQSQQYLCMLAKTQANHLEGVFQRIQMELEIAAANPIIRDQIDSNRESAAKEGVPDTLKDLYQRLGSIVLFVCRLDAEGRILGQLSDNSKIPRPDFLTWPDLQTAIKRQKATISGPLSLPSGAQAVSLCVPIRESDRVTGWIRAVIPLDALNTMIGPIRAGIPGYAWIVDRHGDLISYPDDSLLGRSVFALRLQELRDSQQEDSVIDRMLKGVSGVSRFVSGRKEGGRTVMAWSPIQIADSHWTAAVCMDETEQIAVPLQQQAQDMVLMMICALAALTLGAVMYFRYERKKAHLAAHLAIGRVNDELQLLSFEHTQTEQDLQAKLDALREILNAVPYGLYWKDRVGMFRGANAAFARMVGINNPDEIRGKTETELSRRNGWSGPPMQYDREVIRTGIGLVNVERRQAIQGKMATLLSSKVPLRDGRGTVWGVLGVVADVTEAMLKRDKQEQVNSMMRIILDCIPTGVAASDASGTIQEISGSATNLLGRPRSDWVGRNLTELVPPDHRDEVQAGMDQLLRAERTGPILIRFSAGQRDIRAYLSSVHRQGRIDGFWMTLDDITEYTDRQDRAEYAQYRTGQFMASLSHQIRTAMNNILGFAEILRQERTDSDSASHLTQITDNASHLLEVADELVRLCQSETTSNGPETKGEEPALREPSKVDETAKPAESAIQAAKTQPAEPAPSEVSNEPVILVVDDVPENRTLLEVILSRAGYGVDMAANGQEAVAKAGRRRYDLILMDMQMPVMNGFDATRRIRSEGLNGATTILAMTASEEKGDELRCLEAGCDDFVGKPVKKELLLRKVWRFLQQVKQIQAAERGEPIVSFLSGDPDYQKTIETFVSNLPGRLEEMRKALEEGNLSDLAMKAHALKGLGGFAGFAVFTEKARVLEGTIHEHDLDRIRVQLDEMSELCRRTRVGADGPTG